MIVKAFSSIIIYKICIIKKNEKKKQNGEEKEIREVQLILSLYYHN